MTLGMNEQLLILTGVTGMRHRPAGSLWGTGRVLLAVSPHPGTVTLLSGILPSSLQEKGLLPLTTLIHAFPKCISPSFSTNVKLIPLEHNYATGNQILCVLIDSEAPSSHHLSCSTPFPHLCPPLSSPDCPGVSQQCLSALPGAVSTAHVWIISWIQHSG